MVERVTSGEASAVEVGKDAGTKAETEGAGQDIAVVLAQVSALQSEIDRLIALVDNAAKKLKD